MAQLGIKENNWNYTYHSIINITKNTEKSPGDIRNFAVSQTPLKAHQLMMEWKKIVIIVIMYLRDIKEKMD